MIVSLARECRLGAIGFGMYWDQVQETAEERQAVAVAAAADVAGSFGRDARSGDECWWFAADEELVAAVAV